MLTLLTRRPLLWTRLLALALGLALSPAAAAQTSDTPKPATSQEPITKLKPGKCVEGRYEVRFNVLTGEASHLPSCIGEGSSLTLRISSVNPFLYTVVIAGKTTTLEVDVPDIFTKALDQFTEESEEGEGSPEQGAGTPEEAFLLATIPDAESQAAAARAAALSAAFQIAVESYEAEMTRLQTLAGIGEALKESVLASDGLDESAFKHTVRGTLQAYAGIEDATQLASISLGLLRAVDDAHALIQSAFRALPTPQPGEIRSHERAKNTHQAYQKKRADLLVDFRATTRLASQALAARFEYVSLPIQARGDQLTISLKITRNASLDKGYPTTREYDRPELAKLDVVGGARVDFSAGFFFSNLADHAFRTAENADGDKLIARSEEDEENLSVAAGSVLHVYKRSTASVKLALSLGVGIGNGGDVSYFVGPSLLMGKASRGVLTVGAVGGKVDRMGNGLQLGDELPEGLSSVPTNSVFRIGAFLAFTYNIGS